VRLESRSKKSIPIFCASKARECYRWKTPAMLCLVLANLTHERISVLLGKPDIAHEDVRFVLVEHVMEGLLGGRHSDHAGARFGEHQRRECATIGLVVYHQNPQMIASAL
jgi:hypothetical protein